MAAEFKSCSVDICNKPAIARGYCISHYDRFRNHGDPLGGGPDRAMQGEPMRFIHEVVLHHTSDECLTWPFGRDGAGYGAVKVGGKQIVASRYVCELVNGPPPTPEHQSAHSCGKGHEACISPIHLSWKTMAENMADKLVHGTHQRGERHGRAKITETQALAVLRLKGLKSQRKIAAEFGISNMQVSRIHKGESWGCLSDFRLQAVANQTQIR